MHQIAPIEVEELGRIGVEEVSAEHCFGRQRGAGLLVVQPAAGAKVGDAALGGDPGATEEHDPLRGLDCLRQFGHDIDPSRRTVNSRPQGVWWF
jgi:hypothetical protein